MKLKMARRWLQRRLLNHRLSYLNVLHVTILAPRHRYVPRC